MGLVIGKRRNINLFGAKKSGRPGC